MAKIKELDWMLWRIEKNQMKDPPLVNLVRAIEYYSDKYGQIPNRCEIAKDWGKDLVPPGGMMLSESKTVRPGHMMLTTDPDINNRLPGR
jgi:hypothetical protein